jgi:hypothetical protein
MLSAHDDVKYEYWCDGELIGTFKDKNNAINHYKKTSTHILAHNLQSCSCT